MKTLRWAIAILALAALSSCYLVFNYDPGPTVYLAASSTSIETGEPTWLTADAHDLQGGILTYEWYEDGDRIVGASSSDLAYRSWAEGTPRRVTIKVIVRNGRGGVDIDSIDITIRPALSGAVVLFNHSSEDVWYFRSRLNDVAWLSDQLGSDILLSGATYVFPGYTTNWYDSWDFQAQSWGGTFWEVHNFTFTGAGDVYFLTIID